jgi:O-antigen/teichoic acid export membrane protein
MDPIATPTLRSRIRGGLLRGGTQWLLIGSLVGGVAAYLFQVLGARALGEEAYAPIGTLWTIQYLLWSVFLYAVETYVNREVVLGRLGKRMGSGPALRIGGWIGALALVLTVVTWSLGESLFYGTEDLALVAGLIVVGYGAFAVVRGRLAGAGRYRAYGLVSASESVIRLVAAGMVALVAATTRALAWTLPLGALAVAGVWFAARLRPGGLTETPQAPTEAPRAGRFLLITTVTNGALQVLLAGAPLAVLALGAGPAEVSVVFVTMTAARVPVVLALGGLLSRMLPAFVHVLEERGDAAGAGLANRIGLGTVVLAVMGGAAGAALGRPLVALFFGSGFAPPWWFAAATAAGVLLATGGMLLNQLLIARGLEHRLPVPWFIGLTAGAGVVLLTSGSPTLRIALGFLVGEAVAVVALIIAARWPRPGKDSSLRGGPISDHDLQM